MGKEDTDTPSGEGQHSALQKTQDTRMYWGVGVLTVLAHGEDPSAGDRNCRVVLSAGQAHDALARERLHLGGGVPVRGVTQA